MRRLLSRRTRRRARTGERPLWPPPFDTPNVTSVPTVGCVLGSPEPTPRPQGSFPEEAHRDAGAPHVLRAFVQDLRRGLLHCLCRHGGAHLHPHPQLPLHPRTARGRRLIRSSTTGGVAGLYDYGPPGCAVKANIQAYWRKVRVCAGDGWRQGNTATSQRGDSTPHLQLYPVSRVAPPPCPETHSARQRPHTIRTSCLRAAASPLLPICAHITFILRPAPLRSPSPCAHTALHPRGGHA